MEKAKVQNPFKGLKPKDGVLAFQHMFAMLGATVLVPMLANMSVSMALLAAGIGTIAFYFITKRKVPVFLGSSFAFLPALMTVVGSSVDKYTTEWNQRMLAACLAIILAGLVYVILSIVIKYVGVNRIKKLFPPIVVGPVIIVIGMILVPKTFYNNIILLYQSTPADSWKYWTTAIITALTIIGINAFSKPKSFLKVIPILVGFIVGYIYAACVGLLDFSKFVWTDIVIFQHIDKEFGFWGAFSYMDWSLFANAAIMIVPLSLVTFMEHLGDVSANSTICGKDFMVDPGLNRTVMGDGVATIIAGCLGAPANTTYGENTAVLAITRNYNPRNIFLAACLAVFFGMFSILGNLLSTIPGSVIGGASIVLFGMISASGLRALVDGKVDFNRTKNLIVVSVILSIGLGLGAMSLAGDITGDNIYKIMIGAVEISPLALAVVVGIVLNLIIPDRAEEAANYVDPTFFDTGAAEVFSEDERAMEEARIQAELEAEAKGITTVDDSTERQTQDKAETAEEKGEETAEVTDEKTVEKGEEVSGVKAEKTEEVNEVEVVKKERTTKTTKAAPKNKKTNKE